MPKVGRKSEKCPMIQDAFGVIRNAPYGNNLSDVERVKIIGGKSVSIREDAHWPHTCATSLMTNSMPSMMNANHVVPVHSPSELYRYSHAYPSPRALQHIRSTDGPGYLTPAPAESPRQRFPTNDYRRSKLNTLPVIPPIRVDDVQPRRYDQNHQQYDDLTDRKDDVTNRRDELSLRVRIANGLSQDFDVKKLKEAYMELSSVDTDLCGFIDYSSLGYALARSHIDVSLNDLHQLSTIFTNPKDGRQVAYEKVLSFIAAAHAIHKNVTPPTPHLDVKPAFDHTAKEKESPLLSPTSDEYTQSTHVNDVTRIFLKADIHNTNRMTAEQIRTLTYASGLEVKEDEIDQALKMSHINSINQSDRGHRFIRFCIRVVSIDLDGWKIYLESIRNMPQRKAQPTRIEVKRKQLSAAEEDTRKRDAWFKRFMTMARALYANDTSNTGVLTSKETRWLVEEYNDIYDLGMQRYQLEEIMESLTSTKSDGLRIIRIDQLLRSLIRLVN